MDVTARRLVLIVLPLPLVCHRFAPQREIASAKGQYPGGQTFERSNEWGQTFERVFTRLFVSRDLLSSDVTSRHKIASA